MLGQNTETIKIEIEEYVFTKDLIDELYTFLNDIFNKQEVKQVFGLMDFMDLVNHF